ncbi:hypothetical protein Adi01nite_36740 [Amorphoplanes digitatis]|nr:hypothetical protein Adi01nite_36740 [Actinoplanes digitatis]
MLSGVVAGSLFSAGYQRRALAREHAARSNDERRKIFAAFLTSAREWRSALLSPRSKVMDASAVSPRRHVDGGQAVTRTFGLRSEVALVAHPPTIRAAFALVKAVGALAEGAAQYRDAVAADATFPGDLVVACRVAEVEFTVAAREELGFAGFDTELREIFLGVGRTPLPVEASG